MERYKLAIIIIFLTLFAVNVQAQKGSKVWNDDSNANLKADTSYVNIDSTYYRKIVTVTYSQIDATNYDNELEELKKKLDDLKSNFHSNKDRFEVEKTALQAQIEATKSFTKEVKKELKWLDIEERKTVKGNLTEDEIKQDRREYFRAKRQNN